MKDERKKRVHLAASGGDSSLFWCWSFFSND